MSFLKFSLILLFGYFIYYLLNIIYDLFIKRDNKKEDLSDDVYQLENNSDEFEPVLVDDDYVDEKKKNEPSEPMKKAMILQKEDSIILEQIDDQGIPYSDFWKNSQLMFNLK